jgi:hypothetical protein
MSFINRFDPTASPFWVFAIWVVVTPVGGGCGLFSIDELGVSAKVTLVMDSSI